MTNEQVTDKELAPIVGEVSFEDLKIRYNQQPYFGRRITLSFQRGWREINITQDLDFRVRTLDGVPVKISGSSWSHTGAEDIAQFVTLVNMAHRISHPTHLNDFFAQLEQDPSTDTAVRFCQYLFTNNELSAFPNLEETKG